MIWDSDPWKKRLLSDAVELRRRARTRRITEPRSAFVEQTVLLAAYSMRKLDDAKKLSTSWRGLAVKCEWRPSHGKPPHFMNWHHLDKHYDFSIVKRRTISARDFCHMVIHSYIFAEAVREDRTIDGFFVTSDDKKSEGIWFFETETVISLIERTAHDYPPEAHMVLNFDTGDFEVWAGIGEPPKEWLKKAERLRLLAIQRFTSSKQFIVDGAEPEEGG